MPTFHLHKQTRANRAMIHRGLTLVELLVAVTIMIIMVGGIGALAMAIQTGSRHSQGENQATQHARVALQRIERAVSEATVSDAFPGCTVVAQQVGTWTFPDTLVVWYPSGRAADPDGLPRLSELVIFCPDPDAPHRLLEITLPGNNTLAPPASDTSGWLSTVTAIKKNDAAQRTVLTELLRTGAAKDALGGSAVRGLARFRVTISPTEDEVTEFDEGNVGWYELPWVQDIYGSQTGLRQIACHIELQLMPGEAAAANDSQGESALPFLGSAAVYHQVRQ